MLKQRQRRSKQVATTAATEIAPKQPAPVAVNDNPFSRQPDGAASVAAVTDVLRALTELPTDRAKARVLRFVQDCFDELHGHLTRHWLGVAWLGWARRGRARHGAAWPGTARQGVVRWGAARHGEARRGKARRGAARRGTARLGMARRGPAW